MPFVNLKNQLADILTKAVSSKVFYDSLDKLGIGDIYARVGIQIEESANRTKSGQNKPKNECCN